MPNLTCHKWPPVHTSYRSQAVIFLQARDIYGVTHNGGTETGGSSSPSFAMKNHRIFELTLHFCLKVLGDGDGTRKAKEHPILFEAPCSTRRSSSSATPTIPSSQCRKTSLTKKNVIFNGQGECSHVSLLHGSDSPPRPQRSLPLNRRNVSESSWSNDVD